MPATSAMAWSAAIIHSRLSGSSSAASKAAAAMAGALLRPTGSSTMRASATPAARSCSAIRKRCSWLQTTIGGAKPGPRARDAVSCISVCSDVSGQSCLGKLSRETGHSRVPEPPDRMTGTIRDSLMRASLPEIASGRHRRESCGHGNRGNRERRPGLRPETRQGALPPWTPSKGGAFAIHSFRMVGREGGCGVASVPDRRSPVRHRRHAAAPLPSNRSK